MFRNLFLGSIALVAGLFLAGSVMAQAPGGGTGQFDEGTIGVSATVVVACALSSVPTLNFNTFTGADPISIPGTIQVICNSDAPYNIKMDDGLNPGGGTCTTVRCLKTDTAATDAFLEYTIVPDTSSGPGTKTWVACATDVEWDSTCHVTANGNPATTQIFDFTALMPAQTIVEVDTYGDSVKVFLNF